MSLFVFFVWISRRSRSVLMEDFSGSANQVSLLARQRRRHPALIATDNATLFAKRFVQRIR